MLITVRDCAIQAAGPEEVPEQVAVQQGMLFPELPVAEERLLRTGLLAFPKGLEVSASVELEAHDGSIDGRTDLYAVGCLAWWLLTGRLVFEASNPMMMAASHLNTAPPELSEHATQAIPDDLEALILQCLDQPDQPPAT